MKSSPAEEERMARLMATYGGTSQRSAEMEDSASQDELHEFLAQHRIVKPALQSDS
jgi:hypothetical protein